MKFRHTTCALATVAALGAGTLAPACACADDERGIVVFHEMGGFSSLADLNDAGSASLKTGFTMGGGIGYQFNRYVVLRATFNFARTEADALGFGIDGTKFKRFAYGVDVQLRHPAHGGLTPYVLAGGGGMTIKQDTDDAPPSFTKAAGKAGVGLAYHRHSKMSVYVEGTGWLYKWDRNGFDKTQFDVAWTVGMSYRLGL